MGSFSKSNEERRQTPELTFSLKGQGEGWSLNWRARATRDARETFERKSSAEGHNSSAEIPQGPGKQRAHSSQSLGSCLTSLNHKPEGTELSLMRSLRSSLQQHKVGCKRMDSGSESLEESILHIKQRFFPSHLPRMLCWLFFI